MYGEICYLRAIKAIIDVGGSLPPQILLLLEKLTT
jgi:hypothetical protein